MIYVYEGLFYDLAFIKLSQLFTFWESSWRSYLTGCVCVCVCVCVCSGGGGGEVGEKRETLSSGLNSITIAVMFFFL